MFAFEGISPDSFEIDSFPKRILTGFLNSKLYMKFIFGYFNCHLKQACLFVVQRYKMWQKRYSNRELDFREDIPNYSDEQLKEVLKLRDHYQPEAAQLAIQEALKRGIIHSEQDLFSEEYRCEEIQFSLFPKIRKDRNRIKIRKSIARSLVICSVLPVVYGLVEMKTGKSWEGAGILLFGLLWLFCSAQLIKVFHMLFIRCLMAGTILGTMYIFYRLTSSKTYIFMDFFLVLVLAGLIFYGLLFMLKNARE